jgi:hypothetical protein
MKKQPGGIDRRSFVKTLAVGALDVPIAAASVPRKKEPSLTGEILTRRLGTTGHTTLTNADRLLLDDFSGQAYASPSMQHLTQTKRWPDAPAAG